MNAPEPPERPLPEKDFINDELGKNPVPAFIWLAIIAIVVALLWGIVSASSGEIMGEINSLPFLQVTNRQISVFLWQFPELMRAHVARKTGYMPAFQYQDNVGIELGMADQYVSAPPNVIFLYHTWDRLIKNEFSRRIIRPKEFKEFLAAAPEWDPKNWKDAPEAYTRMVVGLGSIDVDDLELLPESTLPMIVRRVFIGWKNYMKEGTRINDVQPSANEMKEFLRKNSHYARNYWRNIVMDDYPNYLLSIWNGKASEQEIIANEELAPFLKAAYFNFEESKKEYGLEARPEMRLQLQ